MAEATLQVTTPGDRDLVITRTFNAPRDLVFDAWTKPELLKRWLLGPPGWEMVTCAIDLRIGGQLRYEWRHASGREMGLTGVYREVVTPQRIVHTEVFDDDWTGGETLVTTAFTGHAGRTAVAMTVLYPSREARDSAVKAGVDGMVQSYQRLDALLLSLPASGGSAPRRLRNQPEDHDSPSRWRRDRTL